MIFKNKRGIFPILRMNAVRRQLEPKDAADFLSTHKIPRFFLVIHVFIIVLNNSETTVTTVMQQLCAVQ